MRIYARIIRPEKRKPKIFKAKLAIQNTTVTSKHTAESNGKKETEEKVTRKTEIKSGKEDYGAFIIGMLVLYGMYSKTLDVNQTIAMIGAIFLGWGGYSYKKSQEGEKPAAQQS